MPDSQPSRRVTTGALRDAPSALDEAAPAHRSRVGDDRRDDESPFRRLFYEMIDAAALHEAITGPDGRLVDYRTLEVNREFERLLGIRRADVVGRAASDYLPSDELASWVKTFAPAVEAGSRLTYSQFSPSNGKRFEGRVYRSEPGRFVVTFKDVTDGERSLEELRRSEARLHSITATASDAIVCSDHDGTIVLWNEAAEKLLGYAASETLGRHMSMLLPERARPAHEVAMRHAAVHGTSRAIGRTLELVALRKDGQEIPVDLSLAAWQGDQGWSYTAILRDATTRKQAESALRAREAMYRATFERTRAVRLLIEPRTGAIADANAAACQFYGYTRDEMIRLSIPALNPLPPEHLATLMASVPDDRAAHFIMQHRLAQGDLRDVEVYSTRVEVNGTTMLDSLVFDITERRRSEQELRRSEERYRRMFDEAPIAINISRGTDILYANGAYVRMFGYSSLDEIKSMNSLRLFGEESRLVIADRVRRRALGEPVPNNYEVEGIRADGTRFPLYLYLSKTTFGGDPATLAFLVDFSEVKEHQAVREELQAQLQQAQKMESVGRLAGGVAHDFNNMLSVILGTTELAMGAVAPTTPLHADLQAIAGAAQRSADLTQQLLAFARKLPATRTVLDLNEAVGGMLRMLSRLIGENIALDWQPAQGLWPVHADPSQIVQVLTNLCVNARDAIDDVGTITVETSNATLGGDTRGLHPACPGGDYVRLSVTDTGHGMDEETMARVFEPFFTTKAVGVGTGLGLSTVYGIVSQNGGTITIDSAPGAGTTFAVYLPRFSQTSAHPAPAHTGAVAERGSETILLVEDEPSVRRLTQRILEHGGYRVIAARSGREALALLESHTGRVDLLLTDVVMPEMNGKELSTQVKARVPGVKTLFMSGYTDDAIDRHGVLEPGVHFLAKPFVAATLTAKLREVFDRP